MKTFYKTENKTVETAFNNKLLPNYQLGHKAAILIPPLQCPKLI
jgi:hypothetical protein